MKMHQAVHMCGYKMEGKKHTGQVLGLRDDDCHVTCHAIPTAGVVDHRKYLFLFQFVIFRFVYHRR